MKKYFIVGMLTASMLMPMFAGAQSTADLQAQINALMAQIKLLQAQLQAQQGGGGTVDAQWCHTFNRNLGIGSIGDEVGALRTALVKDGFQNASSEGEQQVFVSYDEVLASAVSGFQEKYRSEILTPNGLKNATGYVGAATRKKLNQLYGCGNIPYPSPYPTTSPTPSRLNVLAPNGWEKWQVGSAYAIQYLLSRWDNSSILVYIDEYHPVDSIKAGNISSSHLIAERLATDVGYFSYTVPSYQKIGDAYKIKACNKSMTVCDSSDAYFKIVSSPQPTSINVLSPNGGETWTRGTMQTIKWQDYIPLVMPICTPGPACPTPVKSYDITLIPSPSCTVGICPPTPAIYPYIIDRGVRNTSYEWPVGGGMSPAPDGGYTVQVCISGTTICDSSDSYFKIISTPQPPTTCDNYGDVNMDGAVNVADAMFIGQYVSNLRTLTDEQLLRADVNQDGRVDSADSNLIQSFDVGTIKVFPACQKKSPCGQSGDVNGNGYVNRKDAQLVLAHNVGNIILSLEEQKRANVNLDSYVNTADALLIGQYSNNLIPTFPVCSTRQPLINVLAPNGGETWTKGTTQMIWWQDNSPIPVCPIGYNCIQSIQEQKYDLKLVPYSPPCQSGPNCSTMPVMGPYVIANGIQSVNYYWNVGTVRYLGALGNAEVTAPAGQYTIQVCISGTNDCDTSNSYFKMANSPQPSSVTVLSPNGGETWPIGTAQKIRWQDYTPYPPCQAGIGGCAPSPLTSYDIKLVQYNQPCVGTICPAYPYRVPYIIASGVYGSTYDWPVGQVDYNEATGRGIVAPANPYTIQVCITGTDICDSSNSYFKIASQSQPSSVRILSPNGGEVLKIGQTYPITWLQVINTSNGDRNYGTVLRIKAFNASTGAEVGSASIVTPDISTSNYHSWKVPSVLEYGTDGARVVPLDLTVPNRTYKIHIETTTHVFDMGTPDYVTDESDSPFTISFGLTPIALPDLKITSISKFSSSLIQNGIKVELCNYGNATASDSTIKIVANGLTQTFSFLSVSLVSGACSSNAWDYSMWQMNPSNTYTVAATADPGNVIAESNEGNNITSAVLAGASTTNTFDYGLTNRGDVMVAQGLSGQTVIDVWRDPAIAQGSLNLSVTGLPAGATAIFSSSFCIPNCSPTLTIKATTFTPTGIYPITVTGAPLGRTTTFNLKVSQGTFNLKSVSSQKCLDIRVGDEYIIQNTCNSSIASQVWSFSPSGNSYLIKSVSSGKCFDIFHANYSEGTPITAFGCHGELNQQWRVASSTAGNQIQSVASGMNIDIPNAGTADGVVMQMYRAHGEVNQQFLLEPMSFGGLGFKSPVDSSTESSLSTLASLRTILLNLLNSLK